MNISSIENRYIQLLGNVPSNIKLRIELAKKANHPESISVIEAMREELIHKSTLDAKTQQLVHFALLLGSKDYEPAKLHCRGAKQTGATESELFGVATTAAVTGGMPLFSKAVQIIHEVVNERIDLQK